MLRNPKKSLRAPHEQLRLVTVGLHTGVHKHVRHPQGPVRCPHDPKEHRLPQERPYACDHAHRRRKISYADFPRVISPAARDHSYALCDVVITCIRALKGPVRVLMAPYGSALKTTVHGSSGLRTGSVWCLESLTGPARAVTIDYGRFAYGCSQPRKASARARMMPTRAPYGTRMIEVTIQKNTDNPKNARMHVTMHIEEG